MKNRKIGFLNNCLRKIIVNIVNIYIWMQVEYTTAHSTMYWVN